MFYTVCGSDVTQSGGNTTNTTISVTLPTLSVLYDFFVVAFSDAVNSLPSAWSTIQTIYLDMGKCKFQHLSALVYITFRENITVVIKIHVV